MASKKKKNRYWVGVDIGGTKILAALLNERFRLIGESKDRVDPNKGEKYFFKSVISALEVVLEERKVEKKKLAGIGIGCPGMIDSDRGMVKLSPNIAFLKNYPLAEKISKYFKTPVILENDVNAGLYGEYQFGSAQGYKNVAGIFLGTGVGGAFIFNGKLYSGASGGAGEIGHIYLNLPDSSQDPASVPTLEGMIGRLAISTEAAFLILKQKAPALFKMVEYDVKQIKSKSLLKAIEAGDHAIHQLIESKARILGVAMANVVNLLNPELIVLGGGVMEALGRLILPVARDAMHHYALLPLVKRVKVVEAKLKDYSIVMGAAKLAKDVLE